MYPDLNLYSCDSLPTAVKRLNNALVRADQIDLAICPLDILEEGSELSFTEILPGRNVIACGIHHPLLAQRRLRPANLLDYPWIGGSTFMPALPGYDGGRRAFGEVIDKTGAVRLRAPMTLVRMLSSTS